MATVGTEFAERPTSHINENDMNEQEVEKALAEKSTGAPRVTPESIDRVTERVDYHRVPGTTVTVCAIVTRNGFVVTGESACASPANFDAEIGKRLAYEDARRKVWPLEGYLLRERMLKQGEPRNEAATSARPAASIKMIALSGSLPTVASAGAACADLRASIDAVVRPGSIGAIPTGLRVEIDPGHALLIFARSGHVKLGVSLANGVGVIDSDYRGEIAVMLRNDGTDEIHVERGDRIAQAMLVSLPTAHWQSVDELSATERGAGGFGSTGTK